MNDCYLVNVNDKTMYKYIRKIQKHLRDLKKQATCSEDDSQAASFNSDVDVLYIEEEEISKVETSHKNIASSDTSNDDESDKTSNLQWHFENGSMVHFDHVY